MDRIPSLNFKKRHVGRIEKFNAAKRQYQQVRCEARFEKNECKQKDLRIQIEVHQRFKRMPNQCTQEESLIFNLPGEPIEENFQKLVYYNVFPDAVLSSREEFSNQDLCVPCEKKFYFDKNVLQGVMKVPVTCQLCSFIEITTGMSDLFEGSTIRFRLVWRTSKDELVKKEEFFVKGRKEALRLKRTTPLRARKMLLEWNVCDEETLETQFVDSNDEVDKILRSMNITKLNGQTVLEYLIETFRTLAGEVKDAFGLLAMEKEEEAEKNCMNLKKLFKFLEDFLDVKLHGRYALGIYPKSHELRDQARVACGLDHNGDVVLGRAAPRFKDAYFEIVELINKQQILLYEHLSVIDPQQLTSTPNTSVLVPFDDFCFGLDDIELIEMHRLLKCDITHVAEVRHLYELKRALGLLCSMCSQDFNEDNWTNCLSDDDNDHFMTFDDFCVNVQSSGSEDD